MTPSIFTQPTSIVLNQTPDIKALKQKSLELLQSTKSTSSISVQSTRSSTFSEAGFPVVTDEDVGQRFEIRDDRFPHFQSRWKRSKPDLHPPVFAMDSFDEPHRKRKLAILEKHPEIRSLYGHDPTMKYVIVGMTVVQLVVCRLVHYYSVPWYVFIALAYVIGGSATNLSGVIMHDAGHSLLDARPIVNKFWSLAANIVIPVPMALSFRRYHFEHHTFQGVIGKDPDLPMEWELRLIRGNRLAKLFWLSIYPAMYVIRGAAFGKTPSYWEMINWVVTLCTDFIVYLLAGWTGLVYLMVSVWLGFSFHPAGAHFIQEHYTTANGQETYSYYGWMNKLFLNIGYHNEHHDFPKVPWSLLPTIKAIAPEFYEPLASHDSWFGVLWRFVMDPGMGPQSRCARTVQTHQTGRAMIVRVKDKSREDTSVE